MGPSDYHGALKTTALTLFKHIVNVSVSEQRCISFLNSVCSVKFPIFNCLNNIFGLKFETFCSCILGYSRKYPHTPMDDTELGTQKFQDFQEGQLQFLQDSSQSLLIQNLEEFQNFAKI